MSVKRLRRASGSVEVAIPLGGNAAAELSSYDISGPYGALSFFVVILNSGGKPMI